MNNNIQDAKWSKNVILVDADYVDKVAFNLIVNFERMLGRHIPKASLALWADCVALDGGLRPGENQTQVILIHSKDKQALDNFGPSDFAAELTSQAFKDHLGEFVFDAYPAEEEFVAYGDFFVDALQLITTQKEVERVMVIPNAEDSYIYNKVRTTLNSLEDDTKHITVFTMEPAPGGRFQQEILGYSLMAALRISADEINSKL
ncbi:MAG: hypothetical protein IJ569_00895 [Prevotella sp.]|nr:hypothetical protein [Prevotella sp.]